MGLTVWQLWNSLIGSVCVHILCHQLQPCCWHKQKRLSLQWCWKSRADCRNGEGVVIGVKLYGVTCILKTKSFPASSLRHSRSSWPPPPFTLIKSQRSCIFLGKIKHSNTTKVVLSFPSSTDSSTRYLITPVTLGLTHRLQRKELPDFSSFLLRPMQDKRPSILLHDLDNPSFANKSSFLYLLVWVGDEFADISNWDKFLFF